MIAEQELQQLLGIMELSHGLLSRDLHLDSFTLMLNEMNENLSLVSYSSRLFSQVCITAFFDVQVQLTQSFRITIHSLYAENCCLLFSIVHADLSLCNIS